jgi:outer membrane protein assembly factor BamB
MRWLRTLLLMVLLSTPALAADWPQWLGPRRDGSSTEKIKPWKGDLPVVWKKATGPGHSSPVIADGKVFLHTRLKDKVKGSEHEAVTAYDAANGKELWSTSYPRADFFSPFGTGPQATPAVAGGKVYSFGATGVLACFDAAKGDLVWKVDTWKDFDVTRENKRRLFFGAASSPLVDGGRVMVNVGGKGASVVAFSADKGAVLWKSLDDKASYSSGIILAPRGDAGRVEEPRHKEYLFFTAQGLRGLRPKDGHKLWDFPLVDRLNESSTTPVVAGDLLLAGSITYGMVGIKLERKDGKTTAREVWKDPKLTCYFSTPMPVGKHVYVVSGRIFPPASTLHCVEIETGKVAWSKEKVGKYHAAMLRTADDKLLMLSDLGDLVLLGPDPKEYRELARSKVVKGEQIWAHPALVDGKVYFRDDKNLICLQMPQ